jgi:hypothetical protein
MTFNDLFKWLISNNIRANGCSSVVKCLPTIHKALGLISAIAKTNKLINQFSKQHKTRKDASHYIKSINLKKDLMLNG